MDIILEAMKGLKGLMSPCLSAVWIFFLTWNILVFLSPREYLKQTLPIFNVVPRFCSCLKCRVIDSISFWKKLLKQALIGCCFKQGSISDKKSTLGKWDTAGYDESRFPSWISNTRKMNLIFLSAICTTKLVKIFQFCCLLLVLDIFLFFSPKRTGETTILMLLF